MIKQKRWVYVITVLVLVPILSTTLQARQLHMKSPHWLKDQPAAENGELVFTETSTDKEEVFGMNVLALVDTLMSKDSVDAGTYIAENVQLSRLNTNVQIRSVNQNNNYGRMGRSHDIYEQNIELTIVIDSSQYFIGSFVFEHSVLNSNGRALYESRTGEDSISTDFLNALSNPTTRYVSYTSLSNLPLEAAIAMLRDASNTEIRYYDAVYMMMGYMFHAGMLQTNETVFKAGELAYQPVKKGSFFDALKKEEELYKKFKEQLDKSGLEERFKEENEDGDN